MAIGAYTPVAPPQLALFIATKSMLFRHEALSPAVGIRSIHSPEHVASTHPFTFPYFKIVPNTTTVPVVHQGAALVAFEFEIGLVPAPFSARMFTSAPQESHLLVMDSMDRPCFFPKLTVESLGTEGHALRVDTLPYMQADWLATVMAPLWKRFLCWETETRHEKRGVSNLNFIAYRALCLKRLIKIIY